MELRQVKLRKRKLTLITLVVIFSVIFLSVIFVFLATRLESHREIATRSDSDMDIDLALIDKKELDNSTDALAEDYARSAGIIYLTFDDGPGEYTAKLLDVLKQYDIKATFFVTGKGVDALIAREHNEGHTVGLHSWSHRYDLIYVSVENFFNDLAMIADRVKRITGVDAKLIRFPGGSSNTVSAKYDGKIHIMSILTEEVQKRGYQYFDWNLASGDAASITTSDGIFTNVAAHLTEGPNVVLQHDIKEFSVDAVERIIQYGLEHGYTFKPLDINSFPAHHGVNN